MIDTYKHITINIHKKYIQMCIHLHTNIYVRIREDLDARKTFIKI